LPTLFDLLCFLHLPWDFVTQRPQHLLTRAACEQRVFYVEEPVFDADVPHLQTRMRGDLLYVLTPHLPKDVDGL